MRQDGQEQIARILLIGFSATGKSTTGRHLADALGWSLLEMDAEIERREGMTIPAIFERQGEAAFRAAEASLLHEALDRHAVVVSTGGGAVCTEDAWTAIRKSSGTLVVGFEASPDEISRRLRRHADETPAGQTTARPMLDADDQAGRIRSLLGQREGFYRRADITIPVGNRPAERTARDVAEMARSMAGQHAEISLDAGSAASRILVGPGARDDLKKELRSVLPGTRRLWLGVDAHVDQAHDRWLAAVPGDGLATTRHVIPSGESSKSIQGLSSLYDWMIDGGVERRDVAVAVGGGVVGDLVGFAAATTLRGIGLVQVPTTLLSMVDSSVGGKTGINHPQGKNLIGAFYQPSLVLVDPVFLQSLPQRELRSGFAEVIKHGVIQASTPGGEAGFLFDVLRLNPDALLRLEEPLTSWVIRQNISLKAAVVEADERESHLRQILNFGHTIGHGIEAAGYALLHGEAVSVGMVAAATIAVEKGMVDAAFRDRLVALIEAFGLPTSADFDPVVVREKMAYDKKKASGAQQWILPVEAGGVEIRADVEESHIVRAIDAVRA